MIIIIIKRLKLFCTTRSHWWALFPGES